MSAGRTIVGPGKHSLWLKLIVVLLAWSCYNAVEAIESLDSGPALLAESVLDAFENRHWNTIRSVLLESDHAAGDEELVQVRNAFNGTLQFSLGRQITIASECQERQYAVRSDSDHGMLVLQLCPTDDGWGLSHFKLTPAPPTIARILFDNFIVPQLDSDSVYFLCEDERAFSVGEVVHCEAGLSSAQTLSLGFQLHGEGHLEVVDAEMKGTGELPGGEQVMAAARQFLEPLLAGRFEEAFTRTGLALSNPSARFMLAEISNSLSANHGTLKAISQLGGQTNPNRFPPQYRFQLDFEKSSAEVTLALVPDAQRWMISYLEADDLPIIDRLRLDLIASQRDPRMQWHCPDIDWSAGRQTVACTVVLWGQTRTLSIELTDEETGRLTVPPSLSWRLAAQLARSQHMLDWTISQIECENDRPEEVDIVTCHVKSSQGDKHMRVRYPGDSVRILDLQAAP